MTDFLTRLAQRQVGEIPTIHPRVPALYAPVAGETTFQATNEADYEPVLGVEQEPDVRTQKSSNQETTQDPATPLVSLKTVPSLQQQPLRYEGPHRIEPATLLETKPERADNPRRLTNGSAETDVPKPSPLDSRTGHSPDIIPSEGQPEIRAKESPSIPEPLIVPSRMIIPVPPRLVEQRASGQAVGSNGLTGFPGQVPSRLAPDHLQDKAGEVAEPPVQVTIGRIEVTAVTAAPVPKRKAPTRQPSMSLQDYLARRQGRST